MEVLENDSHIEILDTEGHSLKVHSFDIFDVDNKERELRDSNHAVLGWSYLHD